MVYRNRRHHRYDLTNIWMPTEMDFNIFVSVTLFTDCPPFGSEKFAAVFLINCYSKGETPTDTHRDPKRSIVTDYKFVT